MYRVYLPDVPNNKKPYIEIEENHNMANKQVLYYFKGILKGVEGREEKESGSCYIIKDKESLESILKKDVKNKIRDGRKMIKQLEKDIKRMENIEVSGLGYLFDDIKQSKGE